MKDIDIIRGLLASVPRCLVCGEPATRSCVRPSGISAAHCDGCNGADPIEYRDADAIRAAVRRVATVDTERAPALGEVQP